MFLIEIIHRDSFLHRLHSKPDKLIDIHTWMKLLRQSEDRIMRVLNTRDLDFKRNMTHSAYLALALFLLGKAAGNDVVLVAIERSAPMKSGYAAVDHPKREMETIYAVYDKAEHGVIYSNGVRRGLFGVIVNRFNDEDRFIRSFEEQEVKNKLRKVGAAFAGGSNLL